MKILYVAGMPSPVITLLNGGEEKDITHAPGFFHPWYKLVEKGHQVDFVVTSNFNSKPNIKVDWFCEDNIYANIYDPYLEAPWYKRSFRRIKRMLQLFYYTDKAIRENDYDFVYCWAYYEGLVGNIVANLRGVPCGMRSMGTLLNHEFEKHGVILTAIRRPAEFLSFKLKKDFFIMTNDGSKGNLVYEKWGPKRKKYDFLFWRTGVNFKQINEIESDLIIPDHDYLFFAARFEKSKRHDRILKVLNYLHVEKQYVHLYFAGSIASEKYHEEIKSVIEEYGLENYVHFLGPINQDDVRLYAYNAIANPLMYDKTSLGNVFFEIFSSGSVVIGLNDGSLADYLVNDENGFIVTNEEEACEIIVKLLNQKDIVKRIKENAISSAKQKVLSIDARFDMEVEMIERVVTSRKGDR